MLTHTIYKYKIKTSVHKIVLVFSVYMYSDFFFLEYSDFFKMLVQCTMLNQQSVGYDLHSWENNTALESSWIKEGNKTLLTIKIITVTVANISFIVCLAL